MENKTMMQYFEWYIPADKKHWIRIKENAAKLKKVVLICYGCHQHLKLLVNMM